MKDEMSQSWALEGANALRAWCSQEEIKSSELAKLLGIKEGPWRSIWRGRAIAAAELYARVYLWTGIAALDPRKIPPRQYRGATNGSIDRAWLKEDFDEWLHHKVAQRLLKLKQETAGKVNNVEFPTQISDVSQGLITKLIQTLKPEVIDSLTSKEIIKTLLKTLERLLSQNNEKEIRKWLKENPEAIKLLIILDAFTSRDLRQSLPVIRRQLQMED